MGMGGTPYTPEPLSYLGSGAKPRELRNTTLHNTPEIHKKCTIFTCVPDQSVLGLRPKEFPGLRFVSPIFLTASDFDFPYAVALELLYGPIWYGPQGKVLQTFNSAKQRVRFFIIVLTLVLW
jgi:hypothetical protein